MNAPQRLITCSLLAGTLLPACSTTSLAGIIEINLSGVNIEYDGTDIFSLGGAADPLATIDVFEDGGLIGSLTTGVAASVFIPDVFDIDAGGDTVTSGAGGFFDVGFGGFDTLLLNLNPVTVIYVEASGTVQFAFGAASASIFAQALPFGIEITEPVSVSFSTQVNNGLADDGQFITAFEASGTGEIFAVRVPEPATAGLLGLVLGLGATGGVRRRRL